MGEFLNETLINPVWWFTAIFIGLVISIIGNKLTDPVSDWLGSFIMSIRLRNEKKRAKLNAEVQYMLSHPHEELIVRMEYDRRYMYLILGLILLLLTLFIYMLTYLNISYVSWSLEREFSLKYFLMPLNQSFTLKFILFIFSFLFMMFGLLGIINNRELIKLQNIIYEIDRIRSENRSASINQSTDSNEV